MQQRVGVEQVGRGEDERVDDEADRQPVQVAVCLHVLNVSSARKRITTVRPRRRWTDGRTVFNEP